MEPDLKRKKQLFDTAFDEAIRASESLSHALKMLPEEWALEILRATWKAATGTGRIESDAETEPNSDELENDLAQTDSLQSPSKAVIDLLTKHPEGLPPKEIVSSLYDRITTKSSDPKRLLYSVLIGLRRQDKIVQLPDNRYQLKSNHSAIVVSPIGPKNGRLFDDEKPDDDLSDVSIRQAALIILGELNGSKEDYHIIAEKAMKRGYKGRDGDKDKITRSFHDTMRKMDELEKDGPLFWLPIIPPTPAQNRRFLDISPI